MIISRRVGDNVDVAPITTHLFELLHNFSMFLIRDDSHDIGHFTYYDRHNHFYHGRPSPHHPTALHHYQLGIVGLLVSQIGSLISKGSEMYDDFKKCEKGEVEDSSIDSIMEDNTVELSTYKQEVEDLSIVSPSNTHRYHKTIEPPALPNLIGINMPH